MTSSTSTTGSTGTRSRVKLLAATALSAGAVATTAYAGTAYAGGAYDAQASGANLRHTAAATAPDSVALRLHTSSPQLDACFPDAWAKVKVDLTTDAKGKDRFTIKAHGLQKKTDYTVFLLEEAGPPFGSAEYIGDFTTDRWGASEATFNLIVEEAFALNNATGDRADLDSVGFWFADQRADNDCLGAGSPVTGFDGDAKAGVQMMNSGNRKLP